MAADKTDWMEKLSHHPIFKKLASESEGIYKVKRSRQLLVEKDGEIFSWLSSKKQLLTANLKNVQFSTDERAQRFQTFLCTKAPLFHVHTLLFSITAKYLALIGDRGAMVMEMPQRWGKFAEYDGGSATVNCRTISLDERFYEAHQSVKILDAKWHPGNAADIQLVVLTSDNKLRLYNILKPSESERVFSLGNSFSTAEYSRKSMISSSSFAAALGETAMAFDFAPAISVWPQKSPVESQPEIVHPIFILQENGDIYYLLHGFTRSTQLIGPLTMHPAAEDNYGQDACAILCLHSQPPIIVMATAAGKIYHCIVVESEDEEEGTLDEHPWGATHNDSAVHSPPDVLYVHECVELQLSFADDGLDSPPDTTSELNEDEDPEIPFSLRLHKDPAALLQYHCTHNSGVHSIVLPWANKLERFCSKDAPSAEGFDPEEAAIVHHMICTTPAEISPPAPVQGFCMIRDKLLGPAVVCLTSNMECVVRPASMLERHPQAPRPESEAEDCTEEKVFSPWHAHPGSFTNHIKGILKRNTSAPLFRSEKSSGNLSEQECYRFLIQTQQFLRKEYIQKQTFAQEEIIKRMAILKEQKEKQQKDLERYIESRQLLKQQSEAMGEKLQEIDDNNQALIKRLEATFKEVQAGIPVLSDAETQMKTTLVAIHKKLNSFQDLLGQIKFKREYWSKQSTRRPGSSPSMSATQQSNIRSVLTEQNQMIEQVMSELNDLNLQAGM